MERLVPHATPPPSRPHDGGLADRSADPRGGLHHEGCARLRRRLHLASEPRRSRQGRLPRPTRQRHRADHDRDRRPRMAADDLLSPSPISAISAAAPCFACDIDSPTYSATYYDPRGTTDLHFPIPAVPYLKAAAVHCDDGDRSLTLFLLNRSLERGDAGRSSSPTDFPTSPWTGRRPFRTWTSRRLIRKNPRMRLSPAPLAGITTSGGTVRLQLKPASWNTVRLRTP